MSSETDSQSQFCTHATSLTSNGNCQVCNNGDNEEEGKEENTLEAGGALGLRADISTLCLDSQVKLILIQVLIHHPCAPAHLTLIFLLKLFFIPLLTITLTGRPNCWPTQMALIQIINHYRDPHPSIIILLAQILSDPNDCHTYNHCDPND